jgi:hypothetical protein
MPPVNPPAPLVVTEIDVPADAAAMRFMAVFYGARVKAGFGASYIEAIRDLLNALDSAHRS